MKYSGTSSAIHKLAALFLVASDSSNPEIILESSFPQAHQDLMLSLDETFTRSIGRDVLRCQRSTSQEFNVTVAASGYASPAVPASPYRAVYCFSQPQKNESYCNYAVNAQDNLIYGLNSGINQNASWSGGSKKTAFKPW